MIRNGVHGTFLFVSPGSDTDVLLQSMSRPSSEPGVAQLTVTSNGIALVGSRRIGAGNWKTGPPSHPSPGLLHLICPVVKRMRTGSTCNFFGRM